MQKTNFFITTILLILSNKLFAANPQLNYQYTIPYSGGASLILLNHGSEPIVIKQLNFTSNTAISGSPWGELWNEQSKISISPNQDGIHNDFSIFENKPVTVPANGQVVLTYNVDQTKILGPLSPYNVAMDPETVSVILDKTTQTIIVNIEGKCEGTACKDPGNGKRIIAYYPDWAYWRTPKFTTSNIPYDKINHVAYAFAIFDKDGKISLYDQDADAANIPVLSQARKKFPYLNVALSFGGWSWASTPANWQCPIGESPNGPADCFSKLTSTPETLNKFVKNAVASMLELNFNGIDIDWEYPTTNATDIKNYVSLLTSLRQAMDAAGEKNNTHYLLSIAAPAASDKINQISAEQWKIIANAVDSIGVMTYDFHGGFDQGATGSNFMAAMALDPNNDPSYGDPTLSKYNVIDAMDTYVKLGVPKVKLLVGIPVYGRMITINTQGKTYGLYQSITGVPRGEWDNSQSGFTGFINYNCIVDKSTCGNQYQLPNLNLANPNTNELGKYAHTPWGYTENLFITYEDNESANYKTKWLIEQGFGGVILWDISGDFPGQDSRSIVNAIFKNIQNFK